MRPGAGDPGAGEPFPAALRAFVSYFNQERFWESHEVLEAPWRRNRSPFYKGLIIYASAFVHVQRGNPRGVRKQLVKARRYLWAYAPHYLGVDTAGLLAHLERCLAAVSMDDPPAGEALRRAVAFHRLELDRALLRGDEPERAASDPLST